MKLLRLEIVMEMPGEVGSIEYAIVRAIPRLRQYVESRATGAVPIPPFHGDLVVRHAQLLEVDGHDIVATAKVI